MGWCSGTELFDSICECIFEETKSEDKKKLIKTIIDKFWNMDWDCEYDSAYFNHPIVKQAFIELDSKYKEYFEEE